MLVQGFLQDISRRLLDKTALVCGGQRFTYAQLDLMSNRLANAFLESGLLREESISCYW